MTVKLAKTEARLAALREVGVDVSRWLEKAQEKAHGGDKLTSDTVCKLQNSIVHVHVHVHCI